VGNLRTFIAGLCLGVGLAASTVVFASESIQAVLFPSKVSFHLGGQVKEIEGTGDDAIINYNNKAYIPLRTFAESMGAIVDYQAPSEATGNLNRIEIFSLTDNDLNIQDSDGYVSLGQLRTEYDNVNQSPRFVSGLLKVNKNMAGKTLKIDAFDQSGTKIGQSNYVSIQNEWTKKPQPGDVRAFFAELPTDHVPASFQVRVHPYWAFTQSEYIHNPIINPPISVSFGGIGPDIELAKTKAIHFSLSVVNVSDQAIILQPLEMEYQVLKINDGKDELLYSYKIPVIPQNVPGRAGYSAALPAWNLKDAEGNPIAPGKYAIQIKIPSVIEYSLEDSVDAITTTSKNFAKYQRFEFNANK
jgi:hypothetical protein